MSNTHAQASFIDNLSFEYICQSCNGSSVRIYMINVVIYRLTGHYMAIYSLCAHTHTAPSNSCLP
jgi:hypothetical protein